MKIKTGCIVELVYKLKNTEGEIVEESGEDGPMSYLHGNSEIPPSLEEQLDGVEEGAELEVTLAAGEAFGDHDPDRIIAVPRSEFPQDAEIVPGDWISVTVADDEDDNGEDEAGDGPSEPEEMEMRVLEISPDAIILDANHPYAGKEVLFDLRVVSVRPATEEEIAERTAPELEEEEEEK